MPVLAVPKTRAEALIRRLLQHQVLDKDHKIGKRGPEVLVPTLAEPPFDLRPFGARPCGVTLSPRARKRDLWDTIRMALAKADLPPDLAPRRWRRIGDVVILKVHPELRAHRRRLAAIYGAVLGARAVVEDRSGIHGALRTPDIELLWGPDTETIHVEGGIRYAIDVARVMISAGNVNERLTVASRIKSGATVVDLFAGIGYFTLPVAIRARAEVVYACEMNPTSYGYLVRNLRLNRVGNVIPLRGDCRHVAPLGVADWVIMGHFDAREYLDVAFAALRDQGTIVHHELCPKERYPDALVKRLTDGARTNGTRIDSIRTRIVKSYAPGILHGVAEVRVSTRTRGRSHRNPLEPGALWITPGSK